ncbi:MAG: hypothetical protein ACREO3_09570 [Arenimonas sp.]
MSGAVPLARAAAGFLVALLAGGCTTTVDVHDVCETFAHSETPPLSPLLRRRGDGGFELLVSTRPVAEAQAVVAAARREPIDVMMYPSEMFAHVLRVEGDQLVVAVNSPQHAANVADALCIEPVVATTP